MGGHATEERKKQEMEKKFHLNREKSRKLGDRANKKYYEQTR